MSRTKGGTVAHARHRKIEPAYILGQLAPQKRRHTRKNVLIGQTFGLIGNRPVNFVLRIFQRHGVSPGGQWLLIL